VTGGYTPAERWTVMLEDGRSVFVKIGVTALTAEWLRKEHRLYVDLAAGYMPRLIGWVDGHRPMLILEDLSPAFWPPPWNDDRVASVLRTLRDVAETSPPPWLPRTVDSNLLERSWRSVQKDPQPLLSTGAVDKVWLELALPALIRAAEACELDGGELLHFDVRSDNIAFATGGRAILVDWSLAEIGNGRLDIAFWLPSLAREGGPPPEAVLPDGGIEAAVVAGFFAARAGQPEIPDAPGVRAFQLAQLRYALPWVCRELGLPQPEALQ